MTTSIGGTPPCASTALLASFVQPALTSTVTANLDTTYLYPGAMVIDLRAGAYFCTQVVDGTHAVLESIDSYLTAGVTVSSGTFYWSASGPAPLTLFSANQNVTLSSSNTLFTLASISVTAAQTYNISASLVASNTGTGRASITYGISINSTSGLTWGHAFTVEPSAGKSGASINFVTTLSGANTIRLMASTNGPGSSSVCDGDMTIVQSAQ